MAEHHDQRPPTRTEQIAAAGLYTCIGYMIVRFALIPAFSFLF